MILMREKMMCVEREEQITASKDQVLQPLPLSPQSEGRRENEPVAVCKISNPLGYWGCFFMITCLAKLGEQNVNDIP